MIEVPDVLLPRVSQYLSTSEPGFSTCNLAAVASEMEIERKQEKEMLARLLLDCPHAFICDILTDICREDFGINRY